MSSALESPAFEAADESAVRAVVSGFADTWNRHDMEGMHELDTGDVEWINVAGNYCSGKADVHKGHAAIHRTIFAKTGMGVETLSVRAIATDVAVAVATMAQEVASNFRPAPNPYLRFLPRALRSRDAHLGPAPA